MGITTTGARGLRGAAICAFIALLAGLGTAGTASAKKCKGPAFKCAPKTYHLSGTDSVSGRSGFTENWKVEVDLVTVAKNIAKVDYGSSSGTVTVLNGSFATECADGKPATVRIPPQTVAVPAGPGYPFLGDFGFEFTLFGSEKNTYGGPFGTQGSGHSSLFITAVSPCPEVGTFQTELSTPLEAMAGAGRIGKILSGTGTDSRVSEQHSFTWRLTPGTGGPKKKK